MANITVSAAAMPIDRIEETGMSSMPRKQRQSVLPDTRTVCPEVSRVSWRARLKSRRWTCTSTLKRVRRKSE